MTMRDGESQGSGPRWVTQGLYEQVLGGVIGGIILAVITGLMTQSVWLGLLAAVAGGGVVLMIGGLVRSRRAEAELAAEGPDLESEGTVFTLPPDLATFTGRDDLLAQLDHLLQPGGTASVAIVGLKGMAGVGKSALAVHAAHRWRERFPDGVVWVDLRAEKDPCQALRHVAGVYGYREDAARLGEDRQALVALFRTVLQGRRSLLVLDNAEGLGAEDLDCLLPGVAGPVTVVTSRKEFAALSKLGKRLRVDVMAMSEALGLLGRLVGAERVEGEREGYKRLAKRLGRLPLALDIAGRRMADRGWGPGEMMRRLEGARDLPAFLALPVAEKPEESVALAFALSYDGLEVEKQELFRALGAFAAAGFTAGAVAGIIRGERREKRGEGEGERGEKGEGREERGEGGEEEAETALERLEALSLVRRAEAGIEAQGERVEGRYDLHALVRDYARAISGQAGDADCWAERHAWYFLALADWGYDQLGNPETAAAAVGTAAAERGNLLAAQEACLRLGIGEEAVRLAYWASKLFERSGHWADRRTVLEVGIEAARRGGDEADQAALTHNLAIVCQNTGELRKAQELLLASLALKRKVGNEVLGHPSRSDAATLHELGILAQAQGNYPEASRLYQESLDIKRRLGDRAGVASSLHQLGRLTELQGDYPEARRLYQESLDINQQLGDRAGVATSLHQLGMLAQQQGDYPEARRLYQESLDIKRRLGDRAGVASSLHNLGVLAQDQGDYPEARRLYQESLEIKQQLGYRAGVASTTGQLGILAQAQGEYPEARRLYQESLDIAQQLGDRAGVASSLHNLGMLAQAQGDYPEARRLYRESLDIKQQLGHRAGVATSLHQLGMLAQDQGDYPEARRLYQESLDIAQQLGHRAGVASSLHQLGRLAEVDGNLAEAERLFAESLGTLEALGSPDAEIARGSLERVRKRGERGE